MAKRGNTKIGLDNRSNQLNPNNPEYWQSRGLERPVEDRVCTQKKQDHHFDWVDPRNWERWISF